MSREIEGIENQVVSFEWAKKLFEAGFIGDTIFGITEKWRMGEASKVVEWKGSFGAFRAPLATELLKLLPSTINITRRSNGEQMENILIIRDSHITYWWYESLDWYSLSEDTTQNALARMYILLKKDGFIE